MLLQNDVLLGRYTCHRWTEVLKKGAEGEKEGDQKQVDETPEKLEKKKSKTDLGHDYTRRFYTKTKIKG